MSVYGYVRVSLAEDGDTLGMKAQRGAIVASRPEAEIVGEVESGASVASRPVLTELLARLRRGDTLAVAKLDRLTRSLADFAVITEDMERRGVKLVVVDMGIDTTTPNGEMMAGMLAVFARFERRMIRERTRAAWAVKRAADPVLAKRERDVLRLRARGMTQRAIASKSGAPEGAGRAGDQARHDGGGGVRVVREQVERFIEEHGGIEIWGETPDGPVYTLADSWTLFLPLGGEPEATAG